MGERSIVRVSGVKFLVLCRVIKSFCVWEFLIVVKN